MDNKKLGQGSAFPAWDMTFDKDPNTDLFSAGTQKGMSKRLYIATKAMQGLVSNSQITKHFEKINSKVEDERKAIVKASFDIADELLKQEDK